MYSYYGPPSTAVEQPAGLTYNAETSQWVPSTSNQTNTNTFVSQYSQQSQQSQVAGPYYSNQTAAPQQQQVFTNPNPHNRTPPPNPVVTFTNYYHGWKALADSTDPLPPGLTKEWAQYYADSSSRGAHFFHSNPTATVADFDLPPAPPSAKPPPPPPPPPSYNNIFSQYQQHQPVAGPSTGVYPYSSHPQQQQQTPQQPQQSYYAQQNYTQQSSGVSPSLTYSQYMEKCMEQCRTPNERLEMQQKLQQIIQQAVVDGTLSRDWSQEPLVPMRGRNPTTTTTTTTTTALNPQQASPPYGGTWSANKASQSNVASYASSSFPTSAPKEHKKKRRWDTSPASSIISNIPSSNASYYGPSDGSVGSSKKKAKKSALSTDDNYYGPSSTSKSTNPSVSPKNKKWKRGDSGFDKSNSALSERAKRFASSLSNTPSFCEDDEILATQGPIVKGTCQILEKDYLRLTSAPRPELVRPKLILEKHLTNLLAERKDEKHRREYLWFCSQLKALRQDLTVQHIRDSFTVLVYETHARIALEEGDLNEYNQCQTQLQYLYEQFETEGGEEGKKALVNRDEFVAYRLLYSVLLTHNEKYRGGSSDLLKLLQSLTATQRQHPAIQFTNRIRAAVAEGNYHRFFTSLKSSDGGSHATYLLQRLVPPMRKMALPILIKAYRPMTVPVDFVLEELAFGEDKEFGKRWLQSCGCVSSENGQEILCKESEYHESDLEEKNSLI
uniref:SAC3/GANP/THP3 conserved domain-containing protein n=1 Tax=Amphora coffeiformis TaxID=265554 RepID=A0A7S3L1P7_9STRA